MKKRHSLSQNYIGMGNLNVFGNEINFYNVASCLDIDHGHLETPAILHIIFAVYLKLS